MFLRKSAQDIRFQLGLSPAVAILGARQIGKTTLAQLLAAEFADSIYLDLENAQARAKLEQADVFFQANRHRLVVLDEIQNIPELFGTLRGEIDADRRPGRFLILGKQWAPQDTGAIRSHEGALSRQFWIQFKGM